MDRLLSKKAYWAWTGTILGSLLASGCSESPEQSTVSSAAPVEMTAAVMRTEGRCLSRSVLSHPQYVVPASHLFEPPPVPLPDPHSIGVEQLEAKATAIPSLVELVSPPGLEDGGSAAQPGELRRLPIVLDELESGRAVSLERPRPLPENIPLEPELTDDDTASLGDLVLAGPELDNSASNGPADGVAAIESPNSIGGTPPPPPPDHRIRRLPPVPLVVEPVAVRRGWNDSGRPSASLFPGRDSEPQHSPAPKPAGSNVTNHPSFDAMAAPSAAFPQSPEPRRSEFPLERAGRPGGNLVNGVWESGGRESWQPVEIPVGSLLKGAPDRPLLSESMAAVVARQVAAISDRAEDLASRGAHFAARAELIKALRVVTQALDTYQTVRTHSEALAAAMRSLQEAEEFTPAGSVLEADLDLDRLVQSHRTPVLKGENLDRLTPTAAQQRYLVYAQEQFVIASGTLPAASKSLFDLGRIHMVLGDANPGTHSLNLPKAVALYQSALMVDTRNVPAANELGVLLARSGQLEDARAVLLHGLSVQPEPEMWHNLAVIHQRLGETELARQAQGRWQVAAARRQEKQVAGNGQPVRWVDAKEFSAAGRAGQVYQ